MVRVKPEGEPGSTHRPQPHASKSVVATPHHTTLDDEAFKVTNDGYPVPKVPGRGGGMRQARPGVPRNQFRTGYVDEVMIQAHTDL